MYGVDNLVELLLLQGFADVDEFGGVTALYGFVEVACGAATEYVLPSLVLAYDVVHLGLGYEGLKLRGVLGGGYA